MTNKINTSNLDWNFWFLLPLYPYRQRKTIRTEILKDTIWSFEQCQGILYAVVNIRMTVIKLKAGGLLVYSAIAPTKECISLMRELEAEHGKVKYIIHPTISGLEHKIFIPSLARHFPQAKIFIAPNQWSFPFNLPSTWLGFPSDRTFELPLDSNKVPFADEFKYQILQVKLSQGHFGEVALYHWRSQTLLLTDTIISIPENPPKILELNPYPMLFHARDNGKEKMADNPENRLKGWRRICLFATYFRSSVVEPLSIAELLQDAFKSPHKSKKAYFGLFPFHWNTHWEKSFEMLRGKGRPFVAPILQTLILPQSPAEVIKWADKVANWNFKQIISGHFEAPIKVTPNQFREAFCFLEKNPHNNYGIPINNIDFFPKEDLNFMESLEKQLIKLKIIQPRKEKV